MNRYIQLGALALAMLIGAGLAIAANRFPRDFEPLTDTMYRFFPQSSVYKRDGPFDSVAFWIQGEAAHQIYDAMPAKAVPGGCEIDNPPTTFEKAAGNLYCTRGIGLWKNGSDQYDCSVGFELKTGNPVVSHDC